jgi:hypothetical protein
MSLDKKFLANLLKKIRANNCDAIVIEQITSPHAFFPMETVSVSDLYAILGAMQYNNSVRYVSIPPTPCSLFGEPREKYIVPALIAAIEAKAKTNCEMAELKVSPR